VGVLQAVSVGKGRKASDCCDTLDHVYAGSMDGNAYEFIYHNGSWTRNLMGTTIGGIYSTLALGKTKSTDDDNRNALYAGTDQGQVYEFVYKNNAWQMNLVGTPGVHIDGVCAGKNPDIASDDKDLIYAASYDSWVYGYDYDKDGTGVSGSELVKGIVFVPLRTPGSPPLDFSLRIPGPFPEHVSLIIVDASGRMIQTLYDGVATTSNRVIRWNGCDASGKRVPVGVYLAHLRTDQTSLTRKFLIIR
jgi:hypothetical protein